jgi:hypothetical protein
MNTNEIKKEQLFDTVDLEEEERIAHENGELHSGYYYLDLAIRSKWD